MIRPRREGPSQSPRDRIFWILSEHGGQLERSRLRAHTGMRYALLDPILAELVMEGRIRIEERTVAILEMKKIWPPLLAKI